MDKESRSKLRALNKTPNPEVTGSSRAGILSWTVDELIAYKQAGLRPRTIMDENKCFILGKAGVSMSTVAALFGTNTGRFRENTECFAAWERGRAEVSTNIRTLILDDALNGNITAAIYLDKILGGDTETSTINLNVNHRPLEQVPIENLIDVVYNENDED